MLNKTWLSLSPLLNAPTPIPFLPTLTLQSSFLMWTGKRDKMPSRLALMPDARSACGKGVWEVSLLALCPGLSLLTCGALLWGAEKVAGGFSQ